MNNESVKKALAELVVIVLGVLIALFAESAWNEHLDRDEGRSYASRLSAELRSNLEKLENDIIWTEQACYSTETALALLRNADGAPGPSLLLRLAVSAATYPSPEYQRATYDDLIGTGKLSLIEDAVLREQTVSVYTGFFESLSAWRPPKNTAIREAVVRSLPSEYIKRVITECLVDPDTGLLSSTLRECETSPPTETPNFWFKKLMARPDIEGDLSARAWQVCDFGRSMAGVQDSIETLINKLNEAVD
jgi:hypothetical protein